VPRRNPIAAQTTHACRRTHARTQPHARTSTHPLTRPHAGANKQTDSASDAQSRTRRARTHAHVQGRNHRRTAICTHICVWGKRYHCPLEVTIRCESASTGGRIPHQTHFPAPGCFLYLKPTKEGSQRLADRCCTYCESTRVAYSAVGLLRAARVCRAVPCHAARTATTRQPPPIPLRAGRCSEGP
jgi:hypothetical protein